MSLSGLKDIDREILKHVDDRELLEICIIDRKTWNEVCDDNFIRRRLGKYVGIEKYKERNQSWKSFFLEVLYYVSKMKDEYKYDYTSGNFRKQYEILGHGTINYVLIEAARQGEFPLVKFAVEKFAVENGSNFFTSAAGHAAEKGHYDIVKYLIEAGKITELKYLLSRAIRGGNVDVVKLLFDKGAVVDQNNDATIGAILSGHLDILKYLVEHGANPHAQNDYTLIAAARIGNINMIKYLLSFGFPSPSIKTASQVANLSGHREVFEYLNSLIS